MEGRGLISGGEEAYKWREGDYKWTKGDYKWGEGIISEQQGISGGEEACNRLLRYVSLLARLLKSGCQRKPGKMLKMSTEGGQQNKFILTSQIG